MNSCYGLLPECWYTTTLFGNKPNVTLNEKLVDWLSANAPGCTVHYSMSNGCIIVFPDDTMLMTARLVWGVSLLKSKPDFNSRRRGIAYKTFDVKV